MYMYGCGSACMYVCVEVCGDVHASEIRACPCVPATMRCWPSSSSVQAALAKQAQEAADRLLAREWAAEEQVRALADDDAEQEDISDTLVQTFQRLVNTAAELDLEASKYEASFYLQVARSSPCACACACLPRLGCARAAELYGHGRGGQAVPHRPRRYRTKRGM